MGVLEIENPHHLFDEDYIRYIVLIGNYAFAKA